MVIKTDKHSLNRSPATKSAESKKIWSLNDTRRIAYLATLTSIAIILKVWSSAFTFGFGRISLVYIPYFLAGIIYGPLYGFAVGCLSDLTGFASGAIAGSFNPLITLTNGLYGFCMGLVFKYVRTNIIIRLSIGAFIAAFVISLLWGSYANYAIGTNGIRSFDEYLLRLSSRLIQACFVFAQTFLIYPLIRSLNQTVLKNRKIT